MHLYHMTLNVYIKAQKTFPWGHELHLFSRSSVLIIIVYKFGCWMPIFFSRNKYNAKPNLPQNISSFYRVRGHKISNIPWSPSPYRCYMYIPNWLRFFRLKMLFMDNRRLSHVTEWLWLRWPIIKMFNLIRILQCATGNTCKKHMFLIYYINKDVLYCFTGIAASVLLWHL